MRENLEEVFGVIDRLSAVCRGFGKQANTEWGAERRITHKCTPFHAAFYSDMGLWPRKSRSQTSGKPLCRLYAKIVCKLMAAIEETDDKAIFRNSLPVNVAEHLHRWFER